MLGIFAIFPKLNIKESKAAQVRGRGAAGDAGPAGAPGQAVTPDRAGRGDGLLFCRHAGDTGVSACPRYAMCSLAASRPGAACSGLDAGYWIRDTG